MGIAATYSLQNLTSATPLHKELAGYYLTPETVKPIQTLLDATTGTDRCLIPALDWTCWTGSTSTMARDRMAAFIKQMDTTLNPHRLIAPNADKQKTIHILDPRIREVVKGFLPTLPDGETRYSASEIDTAAAQFAFTALQSGLALFAKTSPCHTNDPQSLTCSWSNFPESVDEAVWLKPGGLIHPKLAGTYFTQRAAAGLRVLLERGGTSAARDSLAELVLKVDQTFSPYLMMPQNTIVVDGSVAAVESMIAQTPPANPNLPLSEEYTQVLNDIFQYKGAHYFSATGVSKMICDVTQNPSSIADTTFQITCGYVTTAADVL